GTVVAAVVAAVDPDRRPVATSVSVALAELGDGPLSEPAARAAGRARLLAILLPLGALAAWAAAVALSRDRWGTLARVGHALCAAAGLLAAALVVGGYLVRRMPDDELGPAVVAAAWDPFVRPLWWTVVALALIGLAVVVACGADATARLVER